MFHYKHDAGGNIIACKTRLVTQGFSQAEGIDYNETFSPTAKLSAIWIIATIAIRNDWEIEQTDIDSTYLNAPITKTVYMQQPKGYGTPGREHHVCCLNQAIYSLKQLGKEWYDMLCGIMHWFRFICCKAKHAVFLKYDDNDALIVTVNIDDLTMAGNTKDMIHKFKDKLHTVLKIKHLGDLHWLLGIEVECDCKLCMISFSQHAYV